MKTINKIAMTLVAFCLGGLICHIIIDMPFKKVIAFNLVLTIGYLFGFWHSKN